MRRSDSSTRSDGSRGLLTLLRHVNAGGAAADIVAAGTLQPNTPWRVLESTREAMLQAAAVAQAAAKASTVAPAAPPSTPKTPGPVLPMPQTSEQAAPSSSPHSLAMAVEGSRLRHEAQLQAEAQRLTPPPSPPDVASGGSGGDGGAGGGLCLDARAPYQAHSPSRYRQL